MAPDPQDAPPPPQRTLADLPPELKAIIARMARDQDLAYDTRAVSLKFDGGSDWDGRSARALSLVDRAWNSAVAPMLFETIDSRGCSEKIFGFRIVTKFGRLVKMANFRQEDSRNAEWQSLLRALPSFVNLEQLTLAADAAWTLFNAEGEPAGDQVIFREALQSMAPSIRSLRLEESGPGAIDWMLPMFVNLQRFEWTVFLEGAHQPGFFPYALEALAHCSNLEHLALLGETEGLFGDYVEKEELKPRSWPSLRSLTVGVSTHLGMEGWKFIRSFGDTLERVTVDLHRANLSEDLVKESEASSAAFIHLQHLTIRAKGPDTNITALLKLFSPSRIHHLVLSVTDNDLDASPYSTSLLETALRLYPIHLQTLQLNYLPRNSIHDLHLLAPTLASLAQARNVVLTVTPSYDIFHHRRRRDASSEVEANEEELDPLDLDKSCEDIDEVLRFGSEQARGFRRTADGAGMERLLETLEPLKSSMMRARD